MVCGPDLIGFLVKGFNYSSHKSPPIPLPTYMCRIGAHSISLRTLINVVLPLLDLGSRSMGRAELTR